MISTSEIKKNGWKAIRDDESPSKKFTKNDPTGRGQAYLELLDKKTGQLKVWIEPPVGIIDDVAFSGNVPGRYQLQIIERCLGLG